MEIEHLQELALNVLQNAMRDYENSPNLAVNSAKFFLLNFKVEPKQQENLYDLTRLSEDEKPTFVSMLEKIAIKPPPKETLIIKKDSNQFSLL